MNISHTVCCMAMVMVSGALHAQGCSGGMDGGMDVTGNECSDAGWRTEGSALPAAAAAMRVSNVDAKPAIVPLRSGHAVLAGSPQPATPVGLAARAGAEGITQPAPVKSQP